MQNATLEIISGISKTTGKPWKALKITIGEWSKLVFPGSDRPLMEGRFELDYIEKQLDA
jgi:hypothetical protein